jgi:hypothetical protein
MPIPNLGRQLSCRVRSADPQVDIFDLVYLEGETQAQSEYMDDNTDTNLVDHMRPTTLFEVGRMPAGNTAGAPLAQHLKHFGFAMINYPYRVPAYEVQVPDDWGLPLKDYTQNTNYLKGGVTVKHRGATWARIKVPNGGSAVTVNIGDYLKPSFETVNPDDAAGGVEAFVSGTDPEECKVGQAISNVYKQPSRSSAQWGSNQVTPGASVGSPNVGYVLVEVNRP